MPQLIIPEFEAEAFIAKFELLDERDQDQTVLALFPREQHIGDTVRIAMFFEKIQRIRHTSFGGRSMPVPRGTGREIELTPSSIKLDDKVTSEELRKVLDAMAVLDPSVAGAGIAESRTRALMNTVEKTRNRIAMSLRTADNTERRVLCAGALQGGYSYHVGDQPNPTTVDFGLTVIDPPAISWDDEDAKIPSDIALAYDTFKEANPTNSEPTHVFFNKRLRTHLLKNLQMLAFIQANPALSAWYIGMQAGKNGDWLSLEGGIRDLFGLKWVAVDGTYTDVNGEVQDLWHEDWVTFARINPDDATDSSATPDGCAPRWFMSWDPLQNPEAEINIEVRWPEEGEAVKNILVLLFDNGLPGFKRPDLVMPWRVVAE
jgi:hypothetical protein